MMLLRKVRAVLLLVTALGLWVGAVCAGGAALGGSPWPVLLLLLAVLLAVLADRCCVRAVDAVRDTPWSDT
jgi:4-hydroxybenzoate polyprenyltransferase